MSKYFINLRLEWMHESLRVYGYINRSHLMTKYGQSNGNSALDFKAFHERYPGFCEYNPKTKRYELSDTACQGRHEGAAKTRLSSGRKDGGK